VKRLGSREKQTTRTSGLVFGPVARKQELNNGHFDTKNERRGEKRKREEPQHFYSQFLFGIVASLRHSFLKPFLEAKQNFIKSS